MTPRLIFDLETDGLLDTVTRVHCMVVRDADTGASRAYRPHEIADGLAALRSGAVLIGHNVIAFDLPVLAKLYGWVPAAGVVVRDTMILAQLFHPNIAEDDQKRLRRGFPVSLVGRHSLKAWGHRLGNFKGDYSGPWDTFSEAMFDYMIQDAAVTQTLWDRFVKVASEWGVPIDDDQPTPGKDCVALEHRVADICNRVTRHGFRFDLAAATTLVERLYARRQELTERLAATFPPEVIETTFIPKVNNKPRGYVKGVPFIKRSTVAFNPGSRQHVARRLIQLGWKPLSFGKDGVPTVDDDILNSLPYPEAKLLAEYFTVEKRLGQIAQGKEAWFKHLRGERIHGRINSVGAHTGRMTHSSPNVAQVPKVGSDYGEECRACFLADADHVLVGCDADALELRDLAGYMALWDHGAYIETVLRGRKEDGTDMHSINAKLWGVSRDYAKVGFYAMIYGCGDPKLAESLGLKAKSERALSALGRRARTAIMTGLPALGSLAKMAKDLTAARGYLRGLDGRRLFPRSQNAALNTLLQSAGAVQMKRGLVILYDTALAHGWEWGSDFAIVAIVHDEWQSTVRRDIATQYGEVAAAAIRQAGEYYSFGCPLAGNFDIGNNWAETH